MRRSVTIDHLVVVSPNLKLGVQYLRDVLGATPELGGKHTSMGTHNCLLRLSEETYLEIISPDPNAPNPGRPRWFGLDTLDKDSRPRLATWVVRTDDINETVCACSENLGTIELMSRGEFGWLITVPTDGSLPLRGVAPYLIQWRSAAHPVTRMRDEGCKLLRIELHHPAPERVERLLGSIDLDTARVSVFGCAPQMPPRIVAEIETPRGIKVL
ncbi:MAG: VOC family protein [Burkholderiales bacterium]|nr:VOC family protein [Burkholderiales bacterium]